MDYVEVDRLELGTLERGGVAVYVWKSQVKSAPRRRTWRGKTRDAIREVQRMASGKHYNTTAR